MNNWELPTSLEIGGKMWEIRTDYRAIIDILIYFNDKEYEKDEQWIIALTILFKDFKSMPESLYEEAARAAVEFIDMGKGEDDGKKRPTLMDWEQDSNLIIPAVNRVIGKEIRSLDYMHWWTFLGAYMEIGECVFSQVVSIRNKRAQGKPLQDYEKEYLTENKNIVELRRKKTQAEIEEEKRLTELFG